MIRGTTPTHTFKKIPVMASDIKAIKITYKQGEEVVLTKRKADCTIEDGIISTKLTQEDTFLFKDGELVEIQLRILDKTENVTGTFVKRVSVEECLDDEVLT